MINSRIQIENGAIEDFYSKWGFIYLDGDRRFAPPEKKRDKSTYAEQAGANEDARAVDDEFDYSARFLIEAPNQNTVNANSKIKAWNDAVRERTAGSDIKRCKTVTFYDDYKRSKVVGIPEIIAEVGENDYFRRQDGSVMDCVVVELKIHVSNPNLCDFDTINPNEGKKPEMSLSLISDGTKIFANTSRPLADDEHLLLMTCGPARSRRNFADGTRDHAPSRHRWHIRSNATDNAHASNFRIGSDGIVRYNYNGAETTNIALITTPHGQGQDVDLNGVAKNFYVRKSSNKNYWYPNISGAKGKICYAFAIYRDRDKDRFTRISNVAYFRVNFTLTSPGEVNEDFYYDSLNFHITT